MEVRGVCTLRKREEFVVYGGGRNLFVGGNTKVALPGITRKTHCE